jgi:hypothetical protein
MKLLDTRQDSCITAGLVLLLASMVGTVSAETASAIGNDREGPNPGRATSSLCPVWVFGRGRGSYLLPK